MQTYVLDSANRHSSLTYFWATLCTKLKWESSVEGARFEQKWAGAVRCFLYVVKQFEINVIIIILFCKI